MKVLGIIGWSGSGKTTLLTAMLPLLRAAGLTVSTVKHTHQGFDLDRPGKDSYRHREAGAHEVLIASGSRWALLHELNGAEPSLEELLAKLAPVDLVLVEGFKSHPFPKLEVYRPALRKPPIWPDTTDVVAVASDAELDVDARILLPLNRPDHVVTWVAESISRGVDIHP
ncbi:molybdopterin-guanine dinucleotide biosynthesis protein B [Rhodopila sp.]|uniref:molybdopterin-guanine dinucleotide biosynthesis protein B n=1 Tax=Rhodopila sp. TaxID=2480087 RepID=UPI003D0B8820